MSKIKATKQELVDAISAAVDMLDADVDIEEEFCEEGRTVCNRLRKLVGRETPDILVTVRLRGVADLEDINIDPSGWSGYLYHSILGSFDIGSQCKVVEVKVTDD